MEMYEPFLMFLGFVKGFHERVFSVDRKVFNIPKSHILGKWEESLGAEICSLNPKSILALPGSREISIFSPSPPCTRVCAFSFHSLIHTHTLLVFKE